MCVVAAEEKACVWIKYATVVAGREMKVSASIDAFSHLTAQCQIWNDGILKDCRVCFRLKAGVFGLTTVCLSCMESLIMDASFALDCNFLFDESVVACRKCWQISLLED